MNNVEISEKFANMWTRSRTDANKSQDYMAKALGVSRQTIQNWEKGLGCPNQMMGFKWFDVLGLQPLPYYLQLFHPAMDGISVNSDDDQIKEALIKCIEDSTPDQRRKLLYLFYGDHGSSPSGIIELMTAHLHTPLRDRITIANTVLASYDLAEALDELVQPDHIRPNTTLLKDSLLNALKAVKNKNHSYMNVKE